MTIAPLYYGANKIGLVDDAETKRVLDQVADSRKETFGLDPSTLQQGDSKVHNAINQFAFMAPSLITAGETGGASFGLQTAGQAATAVQKMKDNGVKFDNHSDDLFILGSGVIGTALGRGSMGKVFNSFGSAAKSNIVSGLTAEAIQELGEKGIQATSQDIADAFLSKANTLAEKVGQTGLSAIAQYAKVGTELSAANAATFGTKKLANAVSGEEPFKDTTGADFVQGVSEPFGLDQNPHGDLKAALGNIITSPAAVFGGITGAGEMLGMLGHNPNPTIEKLQTDNSPEAVASLKQDVVQHGKEKGWTDEQIQQAQDGVDLLSNTVAKLPPTLPAKKVTKGVSIIMGRNELEGQLKDLQEQRSKLDPSVSEIPGQQEQLIQDKIDQANDKLKDLVTGNRTTYSKGVEGDEGKYFKTVNGVKEEITPERYELEDMERKAKSQVKTDEIADIVGLTPESKDSSIETSETTSENKSPVDTAQEGVSPLVADAGVSTNAEPITQEGEQQNAIQEPSTTGVPIQPTPGDSSEVPIGDTEGSQVAGESQPQPENSGGRDAQQAEEVVPEPPKSEEPVSSKKTSIKEQADKVDVKLDDNKGGTRSKDIVEAEADKALKDGYDIHELVRKIKDDKHVATDTENAILAKHIGTRTDEIVDLNKRIEEGAATMSAEKLDELTGKRDAALKDFQDVANANDATRSNAGRALKSGQFQLHNNYSLESLIRNERRLNDGKPLTETQLADVSNRHSELEKANAAYEKKLQESQEEIARLKAEKAVSKPRTRSTAKTHEDFVKERKAISQEFSKKLAEMRKNGQLNDVFGASAQFLRAAAPYVAKMVTSLAHEKITELSEVVKRIREELDLKELSTKEMYDLVSGKYNEPVTKDAIQEQIRKLKNEAKLLSQIDDAENGLRKLPEPKRRVADEKIEALRTRLRELDKENGLYDEKNKEASKRQLQKSIKELQDKIAKGDYEKPQPKEPDESPEAMELRRKRDALRHDYDLEQARRELDKRSKFEKAKDVTLNVASLPRAIKATLDFSAVLRQGLIPTVAHPGEAVKALKTMFGQTFSEKKYQDWFSDIKRSPQYELMKASGLYISEKNNPELLAREEQFTSNLLEKIPVLGKIHQGAERAYTGYLNAIRTGVFISEAAKLQERGYTFKNNPEAFRDLATVVNVLSGRGNIPDALGGKQPAVLSNLLFSPRFMAARIHTLYLWGDPRLSRSAKVLAAKDIGKTLATAGTILTMASLAGLKVSHDPRGSDFLKIKDGDTRYDILGGLTQYVVYLSQMLSGQKVAAGTTQPKSLTSGKFGAPTRLDNTISFVRGKLNPIVGSATNLMAGKDVVGQPYHLWPNVPEEFVPLPATDVYEAYKLGGITNALKVLVPSQFGVGVNTFTNKKK